MQNWVGEVYEVVHRICRRRINCEQDEKDDYKDKGCHPGVFEGIGPPSAD